MEAPIEVLRIDQATVSKEITRFRACDPDTRCFYCREWAQFIYKKHFVYTAKTLEEIPDQASHPNTVIAGPYHINYIMDDTPLEQKEDPKELLENITSNNNSTLLSEVITSCKQWIIKPNAHYGLPDLFEPIIFNPFPDAIPLVEDTKDPSQILDPLIIERHSICLPSDSFHLLKNLTGDILLSHSQPSCEHKKPESLTPAELEVERAIFNEDETVAVQKTLAELTAVLNDVWKPLTNYLERIQSWDKDYSRLMGRDCQASIDEYFNSQQFESLNDKWATKYALLFKKKKSTDEELKKVDSVVEDHFDTLKTISFQFVNDFVPNRFKEISEFLARYCREMKQELVKIEQEKESQDKKIIFDINALASIGAESTQKMKETLKRVSAEMASRLTAYHGEIDEILTVYRTSRPTLSSRIDKITHKDFKKKVKKVESGYYSIRQYLRYELTEKMYPEIDFCNSILASLNPLMQEAERVEKLTLVKEANKFIKSHKDLVEKRFDLLDRFEEGVQDGRRELAGILGKLFLKEGMRIQGDNLALQRQNTLLKSMGLPASEEEPATKKKKSKKKSALVDAPDTSKKAEAKPVTTKAKALSVASPIVKQNTSDASPKSKADPLKPKKVTVPEKVTAPEKVTVSEKTKSLNESNAEVNVNGKKNNHVHLDQGKNEIQDWDTIKRAVLELPKNETKSKVIQQQQSDWSRVSKSNVIKEWNGDDSKIVTENNINNKASSSENTRSSKPTLQEPIIPQDGWAKIVKKDIEIPLIQHLNKPIIEQTLQEDWPSAIRSQSPLEGTHTTVEQAIPESGWAKIVAKNIDTAPIKNDAITTEDSIPQTGWTIEEPAVQEEEWNNQVSQEDGRSSIVKKNVNVTPAVSQHDNDYAEKTPEKKSESVDLNGSQWDISSSENVTTMWGSSEAVTINLSDMNDGVPIKTTTNDSQDNWIDDEVSTVNDDWESQLSQQPSTLNDKWKGSEITTTESIGGWDVPSISMGSTGGWEPSDPETVEVKWQDIASNNKDQAQLPSLNNKNGYDSGTDKQVRKVNDKPLNNIHNDLGTKDNKSTENFNNTNKPISISMTDDWNKTDNFKKPLNNSTWDKTSNTESIGGWGIPSAASSDWAEKDDWKAQKPERESWMSSNGNTQKDGWRNKRLNSNNNTNINNDGWASSKPEKKTNNNWRMKGKPEEKQSFEPKEVPKSWMQESSKSADTKPPGLAPSAVDNATSNVNTYPIISLDSTNSISNVLAPIPSTSLSTSSNFAISPASSTPAFAIPPANTTTAFAHNSLSSFPMPLLPNLQYQAPLPDNLASLSNEHLVMIVQSLHRENSQLIQSIYSLQQEMNVFTSRYAEIMTLSREREAQALQLFEARKQTEMEEKRLYVMTLENRIKQLEEQCKNNQNGDRVTAGFGNQDLFAGYREEMRTSPNTNENSHRGHHSSHKRHWGKSHAVRCGNCGELGHSSAGCKGLCRYCGSLEHLSEACPMN
ncbi:hypothetical protein BDB01DRAFT_835809 [Pilobolus umbonatus]|nr:hypothetical protein BDB01DRAFT_835809 [Pilobolus umbonatus]